MLRATSRWPNAVREVAGRHHAVLLANHGPVIAGKDLETAVYATEELEETAKLYLLLRGQKTRLLTTEQVARAEPENPILTYAYSNLRRQGAS